MVNDDPACEAGLTPSALLAAQLCWDAQGGRQPGLRPTRIMLVGGSGSGTRPSGPSA